MHEIQGNYLCADGADCRAAAQFLAFMVEEFKTSFEKLSMDFCSLHGGLQFLFVSLQKPQMPLLKNIEK